MTIAAQNQKTYRLSMMVACGIDSVAQTLDVTPTSRYGSGTYDTNMRAGKRGISIKLMDLAGDGFMLDGTHYPIRNYPEVDDGDATIVDSYKGYVKYGIPAAVASGSNGRGSTVAFSVSGIPTGTTKLTAHLRDSEGKTYRATGSSAAALQSAINAVAITPGARMYVDRIAAGESWQWDKSNLVSCNLTLRGVETKGNNPELQMSEVEIQGIVPETDVANIANMSENAPIWYAAGYPDEVTPVRRFYLSEGITTKNIVATVKGYDATKFLEKAHKGVLSAYMHGFCKGDFLRCMARRCYGILGRGLIYDHSAEFARTPVNEIQGEKTSDSDTRYMSHNGVTRRSIIAAYCNLLRTLNGGLGGTGAYCDYVDAGLPTWRAGTVPIGKTSFGAEWNLLQGEVSEFEETVEVAISEISATVDWPKREVNTENKLKYTSFYAETLSKGDSRFIETEEPYSTPKFKEYDKDERESEDGKLEWIHSKIGNLYKVNGHYYPDTQSFGRSAFEFKIKALQTAKQRLVGIRNVMTQPSSLPGLPSGASYADGTVKYVTGKKGEVVEFPDAFHATMLQAGASGGGTVRSMWGRFLKQIGDRSNIVYKFKYRGNPRMQPRDIIHMTIGNQTVDMTIDNLTLEHAEGGLISTIECRKGII